MPARTIDQDHWLIKAGATVFVTVLAPVLVAIGMKISDRVAEVGKPADPPAQAPAAASLAPAPPPAAATPGVATAPTGPSLPAPAATAAHPPATSPAVAVPPVAVVAPAASPAASAESRPAVLLAASNNSASVPGAPGRLLAPLAPASNALPPTAGLQPPTRLFDGEDLHGFYTWLDAPGRSRKKNHDPGNVFSVRNGLLRINGRLPGGLVTEKEFENYRLNLEYRWVGPTWAPREQRARQSGVLLHCVGRDGAVKGAWMKSIKCVIIEGSTGDLRVMSPDDDHSVSFVSPSETHLSGSGDSQRLLHYYKPGGMAALIDTGFVKRFPSGPWQDITGFRGTNEIEEPVGRWNHLECVCDGDLIAVRLNGHTVNEARDCSLRRGRIMLQSNGAAIEFRSITLEPLAAGTPLSAR